MWLSAFQLLLATRIELKILRICRKYNCTHRAESGGTGVRVHRASIIYLHSWEGLLGDSHLGEQKAESMSQGDGILRRERLRVPWAE